MQVAHHGVERERAALPARQRDLAHEAVGSAVEQLRILHEQTFQVRPERACDLHGGLHGDAARMARPDLDHDPPAVFSGLGDVSDHGASAGPSPPSRPALAKLRPRSANDLSWSSTRRFTVPAAKRPSAPRSPALTPVRISMPSSMLPTA